jgi:DNA (cytosine-5)-methyltransferase 1
MGKLKVLELFGGIGACSKALERLSIDYEIADYVEIDKYAVKSFNAIHNTNFEPQDITQWDKDIDVDLIMHGSPCQDFSLAGKQAGGDEGSGTRSSLMYETIRIVEKLKPKYVIWENVKNVISKKHKHNFDAYITKMRLLGYQNYYQVLNAKDYGIPQNRERVFVISIRSDVNSYGCHVFNYKFPPKQELKLRLKDLLEDNVDEKYYLTDEKIKEITINKPIRENLFMPKVIAGIGKKDSNSNTQWKQQNRIYEDNIALSITTICNPYYMIKNATKKGYKEAYDGDSVNLSYPNSKTRRGRVGNQVSQTLQCNDAMGVVNGDLRIRKLTPKECWRLMGFDDEDFEKAEKVNSNAQLYKQAGNSIVVNVLEEILKNLLELN